MNGMNEFFTLVLIDELYAAKRIDYSNGTFIGLASDGSPTKTALSFMIHVQSACAKYTMMFALYQLRNIH